MHALNALHDHKKAEASMQDTHKSGLLGSRTFSTASTAIGESSCEYCDTTLLLSDLQQDNKACA